MGRSNKYITYKDKDEIDKMALDNTIDKGRLYHIRDTFEIVMGSSTSTYFIIAFSNVPEYSLYMERVEADGGSVRDPHNTYRIMKMLKDTYGTLADHRLIWAGEMGNKHRLDGVTGYLITAYSANNTIGPERVTNGGFDTATDWILGAGWIISGGKLNGASATSAAATGVGPVIEAGKNYILSFVISDYVKGYIIAQFEGGTSNTGQLKNNGTYTFNLAATGTGNLYISGNDFTGSVDNVSIKEVLVSNDLHQETATSQPFISGYIAPNEKPGMLHVNTGDEIMNHPVISFAETDPWSIAVVLNWNCDEYKNGDVWQGLISDAATFSAFLLNYAALHEVYFRNVNGGPIATGASSRKLIGKNNIVHFIANGASSLKVYFNSVFQSELVLTTAFAPSRFGSISGTSKAYFFKAGESSEAQITAEYNLLRGIYPEVESVVIGTQEWATSNCEMVSTPMGTVIPEVTDAATWADAVNIYNATAGTELDKVKAAAMWCYNNNDPILGATYGKFYNWYAVRLFQLDIDAYNAANPGSPWGWKVPDDADFNTLATELGGSAVAGGALKKEGYDYWISPNAGADNSSGFTALPGGYRYETGGFSTPGADGSFYSLAASSWYLLYSSLNFGFGGVNKVYGLSLRLIKQ